MKIYLDTNVWLDFYFDRKTKLTHFGLYAHQIFERTISCEFTIIISDLLTKELKKFVCDPQKLYDNLFPKCIFKKVKSAHVQKAKKYSIHYPDNVHLMIAENENCDFFVTNDKEFLKLKSPVSIIPSQVL